MKVLIVGGNPCIRRPGGVEVYIRNLVNGALENGIEIIWLGTVYNKDKQYLIPFQFVPIVTKKVHDYKFIFILSCKLLRIKIDEKIIIHAQRPDFLFPFIFFNKKNPKICTLHGQVHKGIRLKKGRVIEVLYSFIEKLVISKTNIIICVDNSTKNYYENIYPWLERKIVVIPVGIDLNVFKPMEVSLARHKFNFKSTDKIILYFGRFEKEKNLGLLLRSFKKVKEIVSNSILVLVGEGREKDGLKKMTDDLNLRDVFFFDSMEHTSLPEIINCADVSVITSNYESGPLTALESIACGVPIVITDVGRAKEFITNDFVGKIVEWDDKKIASAIINILHNDKESTKKACLEAAFNFSFNKTIKETIEIYKKISCSST